MLPEQVVSLYLDLEAEGVEVWLMGGWGVDALLGDQTRPHHDLDILIDLARLEQFRERLDDLGFELQYVWDDETWWVRHVAWDGEEQLPTAFVCAHADGREVDVHVVRLDPRGTVEMLWTAPYELTAAGLQGRGVIAGHPVRCMAAELQITMHTGYELPPHHVADLDLLVELTTATADDKS
jgi:lincosamide nucleotidyltransferase A/C/D/E